jgi:hypothetical protein
LGLFSGCQEVDAIKRELLKKIQGKLLKKKSPFTPRDGITIRPASLYQTANPNSEVIKKMPAETSVHLVDKIGEWYRVRTRDGREGYVETKVVGGEDIIQKTQDLRRSIEGIPPQAEGVTKTKANFRLDAGRQHEVIEILPPGKKLEVYERVVTLRKNSPPLEKGVTRGRPAVSTSDESVGLDELGDDVKKDIWYKVKIEDGRVGYIYTHNLALTPPEDIARAVPFMRMMAWRTINSIDDPDRGAKDNFIVAYAPIGKDPGSDYTRLYLIGWSTKLKRRTIAWQMKVAGILPITDYHYDGKPGFTLRSLHPTKRDKLILTNYIFVKGNIKKVGEEEIPATAELH